MCFVTFKHNFILVFLLIISTGSYGLCQEFSSSSSSESSSMESQVQSSANSSQVQEVPHHFPPVCLGEQLLVGPRNASRCAHYSDIQGAVLQNGRAACAAGKALGGANYEKCIPCGKANQKIAGNYCECENGTLRGGPELEQCIDCADANGMVLDGVCSCIPGMAWGGVEMNYCSRCNEVGANELSDICNCTNGVWDDVIRRCVEPCGGSLKVCDTMECLSAGELCKVENCCELSADGRFAQVSERYHITCCGEGYQCNWDGDSSCSLPCDEDSDADGVLDCEDGCPRDENKIEPGACGCGIVEGNHCQDQNYDIEVIQLTHQGDNYSLSLDLRLPAGGEIQAIKNYATHVEVRRTGHPLDLAEASAHEIMNKLCMQAPSPCTGEDLSFCVQERIGHKTEGDLPTLIDVHTWELNEEDIATLSAADPSGFLIDVNVAATSLANSMASYGTNYTRLEQTYDEYPATFAVEFVKGLREYSVSENRGLIPIEGFTDIPGCFIQTEVLAATLITTSGQLKFEGSDTKTFVEKFLNSGESISGLVVSDSDEWEFDMWVDAPQQFAIDARVVPCPCAGSSEPRCTLTARETLPLSERFVDDGLVFEQIGCRALAKPKGFGRTYIECLDLLESKELAEGGGAMEAESHQEVCRDKHSCSAHALEYFVYSDGQSHISFEGDYFKCGFSPAVGTANTCEYKNIAEENTISDCLRVFPDETIELTAIADETEVFVGWRSGLGAICPCAEDAENEKCTIRAPKENRDTETRYTYSCEAEFRSLNNSSSDFSSSDSSDSSDSSCDFSSSSSSSSESLSSESFYYDSSSEYFSFKGFSSSESSTSSALEQFDDTMEGLSSSDYFLD